MRMTLEKLEGVAPARAGTGMARSLLSVPSETMQKEPLFAIPTCRLRDVGDTVRAYDRHFTENGHSLRMTVFDDSGTLLHRRYFSRLAQQKTKNELFYVGPAEKAALREHLESKLGDSSLLPFVTELFRPSYGGNRNYTLLYSLGSYLVSADDDMRPYALVEDDGSDFGRDEICRGKVVRASEAPRERHASDILGAFLDVLGKPASRVPEGYARGDFLVDTATDLETNTTREFARDNRLLLREGDVDGGAVVKMAQTFRSGTNDIDAVDFIELFLRDDEQTSLDTLGDIYVLTRFRPVITNKNWRMDCGVAAYDNVDGLPPFFPTRLRFEDYIYRLWIQQPGISAAHVPAAQNHTRSIYLRNPPASEILNEEVANLLKRKIRASITELGQLGVAFEYDGELDAEDAEIILDKMHHLMDRVLRASEQTRNVRRRDELLRFSATLDSAFYGFDHDAFTHVLGLMLKSTVRRIKGSLALWPLLLEICDPNGRRDLPQTRLD